MRILNSPGLSAIRLCACFCALGLSTTAARAQTVTVTNVPNQHYRYGYFPEDCPSGISIPSGQYPPSNHLERGHTIYNNTTGQWVYWAHYDNGSYKYVISYSLDGTSDTTLDHTDSILYGFTNDSVNFTARYVTITETGYVCQNGCTFYSPSLMEAQLAMVQTYGLTHINLAVRDIARALRFYEQVFGLQEYGRGDGLVHTQAPGRHDILTFAEDPSTAGVVGGVAHFGFRLVDPNDIDSAITEVERAGGRLLRRGEFAPGLPYAYIADPDGYEIEIWFE